MHNPFALLSPALLDAMIKVGHTFFVRQTFERGFDPAGPHLNGVFLFSQYRDRRQAEAHMMALSHDLHRKLYNLQLPDDKQRIEVAATQPAGYAIYAAILNAKKWEPPSYLTPKIKAYINRHTSWRPDRGDTIQIELGLTFGELFLKIRNGREELKVPLKEVEK